MTTSTIDLVKTDYTGNDPSTDYQEDLPNLNELIHKKFSHACNQKLIYKRLPILKWLPNYQKNYLLADFIAGLTVGLTAIPQGIAYAVVAGLEPQYGLYSGFIGCFIYFIFGSCKDVTIGPTAIMALMVQRYVSSSADFAVLATFLSGIVIFIFGILNLGFLVQFISIPVTCGFTSAAAITIASSQIKSLLGLPGKSNDFIESWENIFKHIEKTKLWDTVLGVITVIFLIVFKKLNDIRHSSRCPVFLKYLSVSRNALAVIIGTLLAYLLTVNNIEVPFALTGEVVSGFPLIKLPPFSTTIGNATLNFSEMITELGSSIIAIPMISILESITIAKVFSKGKTVDATQEMIALGLCNIVGSFFSSMPTTGSFTRTAVNNSSGVQTSLGGIFTGIVVLFALGFLTQTFYYIPKATLAAVILAAMFYMIEYKMLIKLWHTKRIDVIPFVITFLCCLILGLEYGILIGIGSNLFFILYNTARPAIKCEMIKIINQEVLLVTPNQSLVFSAAEYFKSCVLKYARNATETTNLIIINGQFVQNIDSTVATNLESLVDDLKLTNKSVIFWNWKRQAIGVAWRCSCSLGANFKQGNSLEELINNWLSSNAE